MVTDNASSMIKAFAFPGWGTEADEDADILGECPENLAKELLSEFHKLEQFRFGCAAHNLQLAVKDSIRQVCYILSLCLYLFLRRSYIIFYGYAFCDRLYRN